MTDRRPPLSFGLLALFAAFLAAVAIPGHELGSNVFLVGVVMSAALWMAVRGQLDGGGVFLFLLSAPPLTLVVVRSAGWVSVLLCLAAVGTMAAGISRSRGWTGLAMLSLLLLRLRRGFIAAVGPTLQRLSIGTADLRPIVRSALLAFGLVSIFGGLFLSADAAFASLAEEWLVPEIAIDLLPARILVFVGSLALAGSLVRLSPAWGAPIEETKGSQVRVGLAIAPAEWKVAMVALDLLFAAFVVVQLAVLFGGRAHVLRTSGLTYAEYARSGFFQLVLVAILTLAVVALAVRTGPADQRNLMRSLLGLLCVLTLVILVSAMKRMHLYQEEYGFTRLRLLVDLIIVWLGAVFALVVIAGIRWDARWLPRAVVATSAAAVIAFGFYNPDARIAERNVERFEEAGDIDVVYLSRLSTDAVPALLELPEPFRSCAVGPILARLDHDGSLWSFNLSRRRASEIARHVDEGALCSI